MFLIETDIMNRKLNIRIISIRMEQLWSLRFWKLNVNQNKFYFKGYSRNDPIASWKKNIFSIHTLLFINANWFKKVYYSNIVTQIVKKYNSTLCSYMHSFRTQKPLKFYQTCVNKVSIKYNYIYLSCWLINFYCAQTIINRRTKWGPIIPMWTI